MQHNPRILALFDALQDLYPESVCALHFDTPLQLLVATILSAQCTDKRVNLTTPALFAAYPTAQALAQANVSDVEQLLCSINFFRNKAKNCVAMAQKLIDKHQGQVPRTMAELIELPGVARKTANVVLGVAYGLSEGIVVDTHVMRLSQRLHLSAQTKPGPIEQDLMRIVPKSRWAAISHQLIDHGRSLCSARKPACAACALAPSCPSAAHP